MLHCYSKKYGGITDNRRPGDHDRNCLVLRHATLPSPSMQSVNRPSCERKIVLIHTDFFRKGASSIASTSISMMVYVKIGVETKGQVGRKEVWNKCRRMKPIWGRGRMAQLLNCLMSTNQHWLNEYQYRVAVGIGYSSLFLSINFQKVLRCT